MEGLTGDLLKAHKNYKYFEKFVAKDESYRLNDWLKQELPTYNVWVILGLDDIPALTVKQTEEFQTYSKYVKLFDDDVLRWKNTPYRVPTTIARDASTVEMMAKTEIWAKSKQSPEFVKKMLGLDKLSGAALLKHDDYKYYQDFLMLSNRREA
ncbi:hypothetical protein PHYBOEH_006110 [Phytophthora boehmeriae]|uniref:RxLR effector protein n=1 Tax=Phytophthora boehmeriae TaxID=109152 RepID=A0A8T1X8H7_9STRA|nr:hypothetical protein PHYBOEH_006110 [Phytophthora boehmeriae]